MVDTLISIRSARTADSPEIARVHDLSWREAYRGIIPGKELERIVARRGPQWWSKAINRGSNIIVMEFKGLVSGYATYGRNRLPSLPYRGEIFELYLAPEYQGLGFGRQLFTAAREDLYRYRCGNIVVWALSDNARAHQFYAGLGGKVVRSAPERFGSEIRERVAFGFD